MLTTGRPDAAGLAQVTDRVAEIFISYAREDRARVAPLVAALEAQSWSVWWDSVISPGQEFDHLINKELEEASAVIVVWTPASVNSRWVRGEAREAADRGVLVPVRFDNARLPLDVRAMHTTDLDHWKEDQSCVEFRALCRALEALLKGDGVMRGTSAPKAGETTVRSGVGPAPARSSDPSVAVLPFRTLGGNPESEYFSDGMTEDIIGALSKVPGLRVAARTSSFAFRGKVDDVRKIGRDLGVAAVLDGSVRQLGQRLRVTAQLIDVESGYNLWSERWDRDLADVFAVQDEIARVIAETFGSRLPGASGAFSNGEPDLVAKTAAPRTPDVLAYDRYLKGRYFWNRRRLHESITEFQAAVERDPEFEVAYTALAEAWAVYGFYGGVPTWEAWGRARAAGDRADELAPDTSAVALCAGVTEYYYGWNSARSERLLRLALARDATNAETYFWLALCVGVSGRCDEGLEFAREGIRLEPHSPNSRAALGWPLIMARRYEDAAAELAQAIALGDSPFALWSYGMVLSELHRHSEAIAAHRTAVQITGERYSHYIAFLASALALGGQTDEARSLLRELDARAAREYVPPFDCALALVALGENEAALDALERAYEQRNAFLWARIHFPPLRRLAAEPRFQALVARLGQRAPIHD